MLTQVTLLTALFFKTVTNPLEKKNRNKLCFRSFIVIASKTNQSWMPVAYRLTEFSARRRFKMEGAGTLTDQEPFYGGLGLTRRWNRHVLKEAPYSFITARALLM